MNALKDGRLRRDKCSTGGLSGTAPIKLRVHEQIVRAEAKGLRLRLEESFKITGAVHNSKNK